MFPLSQLFNEIRSTTTCSPFRIDSVVEIGPLDDEETFGNLFASPKLDIIKIIKITVEIDLIFAERFAFEWHIFSQFSVCLMQKSDKKFLVFFLVNIYMR